VVLAQDLTAALKGVAVQVASGLDLAQFAQVEGRVVGGVEGVEPPRSLSVTHVLRSAGVRPVADGSGQP
jgi:hypothetical protein